MAEIDENARDKRQMSDFAREDFNPRGQRYGSSDTKMLVVVKLEISK